MSRINSGFFLFPRSLLNDFSDGIDLSLMVWLISSANFMDSKEQVRLGYQRIIVKRGQVLTSAIEISNTLKIPRSTIRRRLHFLCTMGFLAIETATTGMIITICKYDEFQDIEKYSGQPNGNQVAIERPSNGHIVTKVTKVTNETKDTNTSNKPCDHKGPDADEKSIMAEAIVTAWNSAMTGVLPLVQRLTDKRKKHVIAQIKKYPEMEYWSSCFEKVKQSDFLTGRSTNWKCNFDWVMNENNRTKVVEGNYVNSKTEKPKNAWTDSGYGML
jgi:hypothetical protein